ncbi:MAG: hypothetical protein ACKVOU_04700 [Cytophagales bacterium]
MKANHSVNTSERSTFNTYDNTQNENMSKFSTQVVDKLKHEYDNIMGEPDFVAVRLFSLDYPEYSVRKYK